MRINIRFLAAMSNESIRLGDSQLGFPSDDFYGMFMCGGEI